MSKCVCDIKFLQIIVAKAAGGPKAPKASEHWDKDDWKDAPEQQCTVRYGLVCNVDKSGNCMNAFYTLPEMDMFSPTLTYAQATALIICLKC